MVKSPTNSDLVREIQVGFADIKGEIGLIIYRLNEVSESLKKHEEKDTERFRGIYKKFDQLNRFAASIALVGSAFGVAVKYAWDILKGH